MTVHTFHALPPISGAATDQGTANPLKAVLVTVLTLKIAIAAALVATVSLAPPFASEGHYLASATPD